MNTSKPLALAAFISVAMFATVPFDHLSEVLVFDLSAVPEVPGLIQEQRSAAAFRAAAIF